MTVDEVKESITLLIRFPIHYYSPQELADRAAQLARDFQLEATYDTVIVHLLVKLGYNVGGNPFLREEERCGYSFVCPQ